LMFAPGREERLGSILGVRLSPTGLTKHFITHNNTYIYIHTHTHTHTHTHIYIHIYIAT
jgi:hypothetical protein